MRHDRRGDNGDSIFADRGNRDLHESELPVVSFAVLHVYSDQLAPFHPVRIERQPSSLAAADERAHVCIPALELEKSGSGYV